MKLNTISGLTAWGPGNSVAESHDDFHVGSLPGHSSVPSSSVSIAPAGMALVPAGPTVLLSPTIDDVDADTLVPDQSMQVNSFYIDCFAVSNADFARFVASGGYAEMDLWPQEIWGSLLRFVDQTGKPGPRFWKNGKADRKLMQHPVVGVSWFEANAYANWNGKQLPNSSQWQRAGTWAADGSSEQARYPWAGGFQADRANIWVSGKHTTVAVDQYYDGCTPNGVYQMVGNVWEWVATKFVLQQSEAPDQQLKSNLIEMRGGAFDTYLESQATCLFRTGQSYSFRGPNVGFRCCRKLD